MYTSKLFVQCWKNNQNNSFGARLKKKLNHWSMILFPNYTGEYTSKLVNCCSCWVGMMIWTKAPIFCHFECNSVPNILDFGWNGWCKPALPGLKNLLTPKLLLTFLLARDLDSGVSYIVLCIFSYFLFRLGLYCIIYYIW